MAAYIDIIGNLTKDPELKDLKQGTGACDISVASNSMSRDKDGNRKAVFFSVRIFGKQGEACAKYLSKGSKVYIRGEFVPVDFKGQDGTDRTIYAVNNASIEFLSASNRDSGQQPTAQYKKAEPNNAYGEDSLPF